MKILAVTGTRADWGLLVPVLDILRDDSRFNLEIAVTGQHLIEGSPSIEAIAADGHQPNHFVNMGLGNDDRAVTLAHAMGNATSGIGRVLSISRPDFMLILGDRYEMLATALAAVVAKVPIVHLCGGDVTEGAIDDSIRHAITKLSTLHFVSNSQSAARVVQMGECPTRVYNYGSTGIDRILKIDPMGREVFFKSVGLEPQEKNFVVTFHPITLSNNSTAQAQAMLDALADFPNAGLIFTGSNTDPGACELDALMLSYVAGRKNAVFHSSLGSELYFSALTHCNLVLGNSSSGLLEAPSFRIPTVNIGDRQARRPRATSVIDVKSQPDKIAHAIRCGLLLDCSMAENPFGDGYSAQKIVNTLATVERPEKLLRKSFMDHSI